jgi:hypothetical protein
MNRRLLATAWGAAPVLLIAYTIERSIGQTTNGFIAYYAAARALVTGQFGQWVYDDVRFMDYVQHLTHTGVLDIYGPNSPMMSLLALPVAFLGADAARTVWLSASLVALIGGAAFVMVAAARDGDLPFVAVPLVLLTPSVLANLHNGQAYLFVMAAYAVAAVALLHERDAVAGTALGFAFALKSAGASLLVLLAVQKRFRAVVTAAAAYIAAALVVASRVAPGIWRDYAVYTWRFVQRPSASVTASQTTYSLFRHLCVQDSRWNPFPAANCGGVASAAPPLLLLIALVATVALSIGKPARYWVAAGLCLCALDVPVAEDPHFAVLGVPVILLMALWWKRGGIRWWPWVAFAALMFVPMDDTARRFTHGWSALLAYPRLYAAWLLWAIAIREMLRAPAERSPEAP